jgi:microcystin-dependent protein
VEANVDAAHPGGGAGLFRVWATAKENDIRNVPDPNSDFTDFAFALTIRSDAAGAPPVVAGSVELFVEVANLDWDGAAITAIRQSRGSVHGAMLEDDAVVSGPQVVVTRQPDGGFLLTLAADSVGTTELAPNAVTNAEVAPLAGIAESKLVLASDAAAATPSRRTLGTGASQAAAGNDPRFPAGADIVNADIAALAAIAYSKLNLANAIVNGDIANAAAIAYSKLLLTGAIVNADIAAAAAIAESKLALASDAVAGTPSRRTLGTGAQQAMPGNANALTFELKAALAAAFLGDVDGAKWAAWLGGFDLTFGSDNASAATLGTGDKVYAGRTYKPKVALREDGSLDTAGALRSAGVAAVLASEADLAAGSPSRRTLGPGAQQAAPGNDARLSDQRTPLDDSVTLAKLVAAVQQMLVPTGSLLASALSAPPDGYLPCDGTTRLRADFPALDAKLAADGYKYGNGNGATTFNLPDFRGRVPVGKGTNAAVDTLGDADASALANRSPVHSHHVGGTTGPEAAAVGSAGAHFVLGSAVTGLSLEYALDVDTGIGGSAFLTVNWFIKT